MDQALAVDSRLAGEGRAFDAQAKMTLAIRIVAAVAAVQLAVVDQLDGRRPKHYLKAAEHFRRDRSSSLCVHGSYIMEAYGDETIQAARQG